MFKPKKPKEEELYRIVDIGEEDGFRKLCVNAVKVLKGKLVRVKSVIYVERSGRYKGYVGCKVEWPYSFGWAEPDLEVLHIPQGKVVTFAQVKLEEA